VAERQVCRGRHRRSQLNGRLTTLRDGSVPIFAARRQPGAKPIWNHSTFRTSATTAPRAPVDTAGNESDHQLKEYR
jgi:hypothetical protein